jgi:3D (Asp-Asp-Asp) domain-containing protein
MFKVGFSGRLLAVLIVVFAAVLPAALATPALPSSALATLAVRSALALKKPTAPASRASSAAATRAQGVNRAATAAIPRSTGRSALVHSTAYNSTPGQTDSSPFITATGTRVRSGVVALSRDLLGRFPYGTRITIEDLSGGYSNFLRGRVFVVEDTMHPRIGNTVDVWMGSRGEAMAWGARNIRITAVR